MADKIKLDKQQLVDLANSHSNLTNLLAECDKADNCGIDSKPLRDGIAEMMQNIEALLHHYGPQKRA